MPISSQISLAEQQNCGGIFDYDAKASRLEEIVGLLEDPKVWDDAERAQVLGRDRKSLEGVVLSLDSIAQHLVDARELFDLAKSEDDEDTLVAVETDLAGLEHEVGGLEFRRCFAPAILLKPDGPP